MTSRKAIAALTSMVLGFAATGVFAGEDDLTLESYLADAKSAPGQTASNDVSAINGEHDMWLEGLSAKYAFRNGTLARVDKLGVPSPVIAAAPKTQTNDTAFDTRAPQADPPASKPRQIVDAREVQRYEASFYGAG